MSLFSIIAILLTLTASFAYLNYRFIHLPGPTGLMAISLLFFLALIGLGELGLPVKDWAAINISHVNFSQTLLQGMLSFLLFAGALNVDLDELRDQKIPIAVLATAGVLLSTAIVGAASWGLFHLLGLAIPLIACFTFGALISPTDPIAVMALLKDSKAPFALSIKIAGESLFNDGVGIVVFVIMFRLLYSEESGFDWTATGLFLLREAGGGLALGLALGGFCFLLLKSIDNYEVEVMLTLALVSGGYQLALVLDTSGALAIVAAGLLIGNYGRNLAMSETTRANLDQFWHLLDEILNGILYVLIGAEVLVLQFNSKYLLAAVLAIPLVLASRFLSLAVPAAVMHISRYTGLRLSLLTWGGLRGAISIALALTLRPGPARDLLLVTTYAIVAFSILVQATTMPWFVHKALSRVQPDGSDGSGSTNVRSR